MKLTLSMLHLALATLIMGSVLAQAAWAQDAASLEAAVTDFYDKLNSEDSTYADYFLPESYQFPRTGLLLQPNLDSAAARADIEGGAELRGRTPPP